MLIFRPRRNMQHISGRAEDFFSLFSECCRRRRRESEVERRAAQDYRHEAFRMTFHLMGLCLFTPSEDAVKENKGRRLHLSTKKQPSASEDYDFLLEGRFSSIVYLRDEQKQ